MFLLKTSLFPGNWVHLYLVQNQITAAITPIFSHFKLPSLPAALPKIFLSA